MNFDFYIFDTIRKGNSVNNTILFNYFIFFINYVTDKLIFILTLILKNIFYDFILFKEYFYDFMIF